MARPLAQQVSLGEIVRRFGGELRAGDPAVTIVRLASLGASRPGDLSFLASPRYGASASATAATAVVVSPALAPRLPPTSAAIVVDDPYAHFARIARWYAQELAAPRGAPAIHPSASVSPDASLGSGVSIAAYCVIEAGAVIGADVTIGAHGFIGRDARVGSASTLHPRVTLLDDCALGERCIVHSGSVIGSDGFGFAREQGGWAKIPQLGAVIVGDDVEIGANCSIDRGALEDTVIGDGCKLDNLIQVAHNVRIGEHTAIAGCVGIAGSAVIGRRCMIGGGAGILGHLEICDDVVISAMSLVTRSIAQPGFYTGVFPLMPNDGWERAAATLRRLPALRDRVRALERSAGAAGTDNKD